MTDKPEEKARAEIDRLLQAAGWAVQDVKAANIHAARGRPRRAVVREFPGTRYFEVRAEKGRILLLPAHVTTLESVWRKFESLGIAEKDVEDAVRWARKRR